MLLRHLVVVSIDGVQSRRDDQLVVILVFD
jgi:hypothetical protein